ncbi:MAG TPA: hypothetical protein VNJ08_02125 [Bacteriovoracaceae bacterium]|nr:hypothetical protein [Bacteriovoracaceae bacterium]
MRLIFVLLLISFNAFAIEWRDLEVLKTYQLSQNFQLPQTERSGSGMDFTKGEVVLLKEQLPLSGFNVMLYIFKYIPCPGQDMQTDLEIIPVQGTSPVIEIGTQLEKGCELNVYIEVKDLFTKSFFE